MSCIMLAADHGEYFHHSRGENSKMLPQELIPTRLGHTSERPPVVVKMALRPSRFRTGSFLYRLVLFGLTTLWLRLTLRLTPRQFARNVRTILLQLGTVWIKLG